MKVIPLAADSLGVRSMATYVEVADTGILIDPGATLAPSRFTLPHGVEATTLGYVVALTVVDPIERERFVFASDVQGPLSGVAAGWLIQQRPTLLYLAGPPAYIEREIGTAMIERGIDNLLRVMDATGCRVIMDHHAVRDAAFGARFERLWST